MPRHQAAAVDHDSQKENTPNLVRVKAEKFAKSNKQVDNDDNDEQPEGSPKGRKRTRVNEEGQSRPTDEEEHVEPRAEIKTLPRDTDGYIPGSIVRIQLRNFVTYDSVEFRPGPYLNMIIGPNGTGKSSIACAICLGLNWPPSILGRGTDIQTFVKQSTTDGHVEIELKGAPGKRNLVIRRNLFADRKTTTFTLNGSSATGKEVSDCMRKLNVQVGNLCSFLPQDKVSEFAAMTPQQLLKETQRAAGNSNLTSWHETLMSSGKELRSMLETIKNESDQLNQMRERNAGIERDVERVRERQQIEHAIEILDILIPVQEYRELRVLYQEAKVQQRKLHQKVRMLKERNAPAHDYLVRLETQAKDLEKKRDGLKKVTQGNFQKLSKKWAENERLETEAEDLNDKLEGLDKQEKQRATNIRNAESSIRKLEDDLKIEVKVESEQAIQEAAKALNYERHGITANITSTNASMKVNINERSAVENRIGNLKNQIRQLDSVDVQKLDNLRRWDADTADVIVWLRQNQTQFKHPIIEPPVMTLTVTDPKYTSAVEACFNANQLKTFVAQCHEDYNTFNRLVQDQQCIGRRVRVAIWFRAQQTHLQSTPPMEVDELRALKFNGYAIDFVTHPPEMLWFLQVDIHLHRTAIALASGLVDIDKAMAAVAPSGGANFVTGNTMHQVSRSRYGRKLVQNMTRGIRNARNLAATSVDVERKRGLEGQIRELETELSVALDQAKELEKRLDELHKENDVFEDRAHALKQRREAIKEERARVAKIKGNLDRHKRNLQEMKNAPSPQVERDSIKRKLKDLTKKRVSNLKEYSRICRSIISDQRETTKCGLEYLQVGANRAALKALCDIKDEKFNRAMEEFNRVDELFHKRKDESAVALERSKAVIGALKGDIKEEYGELRQKRAEYDNALQRGENPDPTDVDLRSLEELVEELENQKAKLELTIEANPGVVEQYEKRKRDIETLEQAIEERQRKADKVEKNIKNARDNWQPALEKLVKSIGTKFSAAFDGIGCAGEIRISENEDYEKWAIDILVKFRDDEKLQLLTGQRQSGGERSLTTILYLMSLTEEARAPFSLVDEINQGMDQRAERVVHNSLVNVTCQNDAAQYFLITPKLLADLEYHERMKVLCVNNGEWVPEEKGLGNMMNMIEGYVNHNRTRAATTN
ncbi:P-loop containing nucleoside triphosphate hydrolase protein [Mycena floridula]|nr:P-loop containing nucleoside triphosphate hydrolase protein [Mycena floridula]